MRREGLFRLTVPEGLAVHQSGKENMTSRAGRWELTFSTASKWENRWEAKVSTLKTQCSNFLPSPRLHQTASQSGNQLFKYVCPWRGIPFQISTLPKPPVLTNIMKHKTVFSLDVADCKLQQHQSMFLLVDGQYHHLHSSQWRNYDTLPRPLGPTSVSGTHPKLRISPLGPISCKHFPKQEWASCNLAKVCPSPRKVFSHLEKCSVAGWWQYSSGDTSLPLFICFILL